MTRVDVALLAALARSGASDPAVLADRLAAACVAVLGIAGAAITFSLQHGRWLPVGVSDPASELAERLQFTLGAGPCAEVGPTPVRADLQELRRRWPALATRLVDRTPFRSLVRVPLTGGLSHLAALHLHLTRPDGTGAPEAGVAEAAHFVSQHLMAATGPGAPGRELGRPGWLLGPRVEARQRIWRATALLCARDGGTGQEALGLLRAMAVERGLDLDEVADLVVAGQWP